MESYIFDEEWKTYQMFGHNQSPPLFLGIVGVDLKINGKLCHQRTSSCSLSLYQWICIYFLFKYLDIFDWLQGHGWKRLLFWLWSRWMNDSAIFWLMVVCFEIWKETWSFFCRMILTVFKIWNHAGDYQVDGPQQSTLHFTYENINNH